VLLLNWFAMSFSERKCNAMQFLLCPLGTYGDVNPFIRIGVRLQKSGHNVSVITADEFEKDIIDKNLNFKPAYDSRIFADILNHKDLWHPLKSIKILMDKLAIPSIPLLYEAIRSMNLTEDTVIVTGPLSIGARIAAEKWNFRLVTLCLQPMMIQSMESSPVIAGIPSMIQQNTIARKMLYSLSDIYANTFGCKKINEFRKSIGLTDPVKKLMQWWLWDNPSLTLFPEWFAPPQTDWPPDITMCGFPLESVRPDKISDDALSEFLNDGEAPLVFTLGSGMMQWKEYLDEMIAACRKRNWRAVIIGPGADMLPDNLQGQFHVLKYAEFSSFLHLCRAIIHHGGIGTTAEAFRAGIPQLIMPLAFDQPDNAARVRKSGVGDFIMPREFKTERIIKTLSGLIDSEDTLMNCRRIAAMFSTSDGIENACAFLVS